jgi:hypothetical protein
MGPPPAVLSHSQPIVRRKTQMQQRECAALKLLGALAVEAWTTNKQENLQQRFVARNLWEARAGSVLLLSKRSTPATELRNQRWTKKHRKRTKRTKPRKPYFLYY